MCQLWAFLETEGGPGEDTAVRVCFASVVNQMDVTGQNFLYNDSKFYELGALT